MMEILATLLLIVAARLAHGNPDGAPIEACSTLTPQHESASELVCGADCPFRLTLQAIDSIQVMLDDGQLPMYSCDSEHTGSFLPNVTALCSVRSTLCNVMYSFAAWN